LQIFNTLCVALAMGLLAGCGSGEPASAAKSSPGGTAGSGAAVSGASSPAAPAGGQAAASGDQRSRKAKVEKYIFDDKYEDAFKLLREYMSQNPSDQENRLYFGRLLYYDGRAEDAVKVWEAGLRNTPADFDLLQNIGLVRLRQGVDGPSVYQWRGMRQALESPGPQAEQQFKRDHLLMAVDSLEKGLRLRPDSIDVGQGLAQAYQQLGQWEEALRIWRGLITRHPQNANLRILSAYASDAAGQPQEALAAIEQAFRINPQAAEAFQFLSKYYQKNGNPALAEENRCQAVLYGWLVAVGRVPYTKEHWRMYQVLSGEGTPDDQAAVEKLAADRRSLIERLAVRDTPAARALLATVCYYKRLDQPLIDRAMNALESWRADDALLFLSNKALYPVVRKRAIEWLVKTKDRRAFEPLADIVRNDIRLSHTVEAAEMLARLGDSRAVPVLVEVLDPHDILIQQGRALADAADPGWRVSRGRAAYALGAFDLPEARAALQAGLKNETVAIFCQAGLYRLTRNPEHLAAIRAAIAREPKFCQWFAAESMRRMPVPEAREFGQKWLDKMKSEYQPEQPEIVTPQ